MPKTNVENLVDINERKGLPRKYRFNPLVRWFTIFLGSFIVFYAVFIIFTKIDADSTLLYKIFPFVLILLAFNSMYKNLFTLNSIYFTEKYLFLNCIASSRLAIKWENIKKLSLAGKKFKAIKLVYFDIDRNKNYYIPTSFPNILEILNSIAEMCGNGIEYDDFVSKIIITNEEKEKISKSKNS